MIAPQLACTVRNCGLPLAQHERRYACTRGHSYDVARSGYVSLLQPHDRKSLAAGDSPNVVESRARLLAAGVGLTLIGELTQRVSSWPMSSDAAIADLGSGSGDALAACAAGRTGAAIGIDLSTAAARHAARRFPQLTWVVANVDRRVPLVSGRMSALLSLHGRRNPSECARALEPAGLLLIAVPAPDDLVELRTTVQGARVERSRIDAVLDEHAPFFEPIERFSSHERRTLDHESLVDLLRSTYRGARTSLRGHIDALSTMDVTLASECVVFRKRKT